MAPLGIQLELFSSEQTFGARSSTYLFSEDIKFDCRVEFDTQAIDLEALECIRKVFFCFFWNFKVSVIFFPGKNGQRGTPLPTLPSRVRIRESAIETWIQPSHVLRDTSELILQKGLTQKPLGFRIFLQW